MGSSAVAVSSSVCIFPRQKVTTHPVKHQTSNIRPSRRRRRRSCEAERERTCARGTDRPICDSAREPTGLDVSWLDSAHGEYLNLQRNLQPCSHLQTDTVREQQRHVSTPTFLITTVMTDDVPSRSVPKSTLGGSSRKPLTTHVWIHQRHCLTLSSHRLFHRQELDMKAELTSLPLTS
ncbi:unnamed protein product [Lampetra planeri]